MTRKRTTDNELVVSAGGSAAPTRRKSPVRRAKHTPLPAEVSTDTQAPSIVYEPSREEIAQLAFLYWESRGYQGGSSEEDWLRAEQELRVRAAAATA
jgi:Protein of unknown function (DUF2934)